MDIHKLLVWAYFEIEGEIFFAEERAEEFPKASTRVGVVDAVHHLPQLRIRREVVRGEFRTEGDGRGRFSVLPLGNLDRGDHGRLDPHSGIESLPFHIGANFPIAA